MKIKKMLSQHRRDFSAIYVCEHCDFEEVSNGYDDTYFHESVIPNMSCKKCNKKASDDYIPQSCKYPDSFVV